MQVTNVVPFARRVRRRGLGQWESLIPLATQFIAGGSPGAGGAGTGTMTTPSGDTVATSIGVSPVISVSPQISPVFQQQFQPSNSPATAGTSQVAPALPAPPPTPAINLPGAIPPGYTGAGAPLPTGYSPPSTLPSVPVPEIPRQDVLAQYLPWILGGVGVVAAVMLYMRYKKRA